MGIEIYEDIFEKEKGRCNTIQSLLIGVVNRELALSMYSFIDSLVESILLNADNMNEADEVYNEERKGSNIDEE